MIDKGLVETCRNKLILAKADILNRIQDHMRDFTERANTTVGDEADQSTSLLMENQLFVAHKRLRQRLYEIELALSRIDKGIYGICEETEEPIEPNRLLSIPWTRLSIEGAEIREAGEAEAK